MRRLRFLNWGLICVGIGVIGGLRRLFIQTPATEARELAVLIGSVGFVLAGLVLIGIHLVRSGRSPGLGGGQGPPA